ncbi:uncharacterized protein CANTADRAFT_22090 [Suhomyces tanzawaensis NRRL Y-17324]|uniref:Uncharacterized protein n=1 Tax=Suhomyces tanzawaensis NRRL Y-17324 TaxID=984487 RepID=A0A1E4SIM0_9ASCO|nr:uncharacterized protein CANTADRAFT_22090 [Suhomyces tanzawaensis NRRL Y-17324]ODV79349.1 hypothetical protein CANTADRAFT_22090 [Suhomyces tanzawaensis NRRL Y-17324]
MDPDDSVDLFLNQSFKLHKTNQLLPLLSPHQLEYLKVNLAQHLYDDYCASIRHQELIPRYHSIQDVYNHLKVSQGLQNAQYQIQYVVIRCGTLLPKQILIFINSGQNSASYNTVVLKRITSYNDAYLLSLLENMVGLEVPMVIREYRLQDRHILDITNQLLTGLVARHEQRVPGRTSGVLELAVGDIEITYGISDKAINKNLRDITVTVPSTDLDKFQDGPVVSEIHAFILRTTTLNLENLGIVKFGSALISLTVDGRVRIGGDRLPDNIKRESVWGVMESFMAPISGSETAS